MSFISLDGLLPGQGIVNPSQQNPGLVYNAQGEAVAPGPPPQWMINSPQGAYYLTQGGAPSLNLPPPGIHMPPPAPNKKAPNVVSNYALNTYYFLFNCMYTFCMLLLMAHSALAALNKCNKRPFRGFVFVRG